MHDYEEHIGEYIQGPEECRKEFFGKYSGSIGKLAVPLTPELFAAIDDFYVYLVNGLSGRFQDGYERFVDKYGEDAVVLFNAFYVHKGYSTEFAVKEVFRTRSL